VFTGDDPLNATDPLGLIALLNPRAWSKGHLPKVESQKLERILKAKAEPDTGPRPAGRSDPGESHGSVRVSPSNPLSARMEGLYAGVAKVELSLRSLTRQWWC
jgi:hypothetical protein